MSERISLIARLHDTLAEEVVAVRGVLEMLGRESDALLRRDAEVLLAISHSKAAAVARAASLGQQRTVLLQENPHLDQSGMTSALEQLHKLATECRQQNEANGLMIRGQRRRIEGALNILRGGQHGVDLYGRDGAATQLTRLSREPLASW
jgi:flagellar biosynthesis/type III secretory pathway chaperone